VLSFNTSCYVQAEEQLRNSKMLDLLYVSRAHKLVPHILFYYQNYSHLPHQERPVLPIDPSARLVNVLVNCHVLYLSILVRFFIRLMDLSCFLYWQWWYEWIFVVIWKKCVQNRCIFSHQRPAGYRV